MQDSGSGCQGVEKMPQQKSTVFFPTTSHGREEELKVTLQLKQLTEFHATVGRVGVGLI